MKTTTTPAEPGRRALRIRVLRETLHRLTTTETGDSPTDDLPAATVRRILAEMLADMTPSPDTDTPTTPAPVCGPACAEAHAYQPGCTQCIPGGWVELLGSDDVHEDPDTTPAPVDPALRERVARAIDAGFRVFNDDKSAPARLGECLTTAVLAELAPELTRAHLAEQAETALTRVRAVVDEPLPLAHLEHRDEPSDEERGWAAAMAAVEEALTGPAEENQP